MYETSLRTRGNASSRGARCRRLAPDVTILLCTLNGERQGRFRHWQDLNVAALTRLWPHMCPENRRVFGLFCKARKQPFLERATILAESGVYRQTLLGNIG